MKYPAQLSEVFDFGKYSGKDVEFVIDVEPFYIAWLLDNHDEFDLAVGARKYFVECLKNDDDLNERAKR